MMPHKPTLENAIDYVLLFSDIRSVIALYRVNRWTASHIPHQIRLMAQSVRLDIAETLDSLRRVRAVPQNRQLELSARDLTIASLASPRAATEAMPFVPIETLAEAIETDRNLQVPAQRALRREAITKFAIRISWPLALPTLFAAAKLAAPSEHLSLLTRLEGAITVGTVPFTAMWPLRMWPHLFINRFNGFFNLLPRLFPDYPQQETLEDSFYFKWSNCSRKELIIAALLMLAHLAVAGAIGLNQAERLDFSDYLFLIINSITLPFDLLLVTQEMRRFGLWPLPQNPHPQLTFARAVAAREEAQHEHAS